MPTWLIVVLVVLLLLAIGGAVAQGRRLSRERATFDSHIDRLNHDLAEAHATDKGWEREGLERAAENALAEAGGAGTATGMTLVQVEDRPGTEDDRAVFRVHQATGPDRTLTLARHDGAWVLLGLD
jgi:hypothetical protein